MTSNSDSRRYNNPIMGSLLTQLHDKRQTQDISFINKVKEDRKMHHSMSLIQSRKNQLDQRKLFNNKTNAGGLLDKKVKPVPYIFIPKYKNDTFIMPDRVFAKGPAGRRFHIKMKDSSIYSFREPETSEVSKVLNKEEKQKTIVSRQVQEFDRIVDQADGIKKAKNNTWHLRHQKQFNYAHTGSQLFSQCEPMLGPQETQNIVKRKVSLAKTFDFSKKWRPNSRKASSPFTEAVSKSAFNHYAHYSSVM